jgi:hypothetical protein
MRRKVYDEFGREIGTMEDHDTRDPGKANIGLVLIGILIIGAIIFRYKMGEWPWQ